MLHHGATWSKQLSHPRLLRSFPLLLAVPALLLASFAVFSSDVSSFTHGFNKHQPVQRGANRKVANIAFLIQTYNKSIELVPSLLDAIYHPDNVYVIHVDAKTSPQDVKPIHDYIAKRKYSHNVGFMPSEPLSYMGISLVLNTINAMSFLLKRFKRWDYFINISAADYPLVPPDYMRQLLAHPSILSQNTSFIQPFGNPYKLRYPLHDNRFSTVYVDSSLWLPHTSIRAAFKAIKGRDCSSGCMHAIAEGLQMHPLIDWPDGNMRIVKTEAWMIVHRSFANFIVDSTLSRRLQAIFSNVLGPEEYFFGTLVALSEEFRDKVAWDAFRFVLWKYKLEGTSSPPNLDSGRVQNVTDYVQESGALFCRKLGKVTSPLKRFIDDKMLGRGNLKTRDLAHLDLVRSRVECIARHRNRFDEEGLIKGYKECRKPSLRGRKQSKN